MNVSVVPCHRPTSLETTVTLAEDHLAVKNENQKRAADRGQWASKTEYMLAVAGNVVGLGNVWRFPYLCYRNGGGAFLVPYGLLSVVLGVPMFLLESSVGQYTQEGFVTCWRKLCPLAQGIGCAQLVTKMYDFSYILMQVWALFYLVFSFRAQLPWATCENTWNTDKKHYNSTMRRALGISGGIDELGSVRWELALCLLACWVFCYFSIWKGVRSSGKVVYFTATFPYVMLLILLVRGATLPGAWEGIYYYLYPDLNRLANLEVWLEAGSQICFSYSLTVGILNVLGSYNKYNNNCYKDCFWLCLLNSGTSFVAGFVVFSVLGFMAQKQGVPVESVVESGPGLAFIAYPQATAMMPFPQFWTVCFFLMLILLSVDTHFVTVECFITTISDLFPKLFRKPGRHELLVLFVCSSFFLVHLLLVTEGGIYIFHNATLYDLYEPGLTCLFVSGADRLINIIEDMTGQRPSVFFKLCWKYIIPLLSLVSQKWLNTFINDWYTYPDWAYALGWAMTLSSVLMVPLWAAGQMCVTAGTFRQVSAHLFNSIQLCYLLIWSVLVFQRLFVLCRPTEDLDRQERDLEDEGTTVELRTSAATS
uniref:Transporter n=1 Tax=Cyclopterus lumpus TaxID=8103 RepID=A0A8C3A535_CYCLU